MCEPHEPSPGCIEAVSIVLRRRSRRRISFCAAWRTWRTCGSVRRSKSTPTASLRCRCVNSAVYLLQG